MVMAETQEDRVDVEACLKPLPAAHVLTSHQLKQVTWLDPESRGR
jgi:hypothetical protein